MHVTMVKKVLLDGSPCQKCAQAEALLKRRGLWSLIDEVIVAKEADPESPGMRFAEERGVTLAPFFVVKDSLREEVYTSVLELVQRRLAPNGSKAMNDHSASPSTNGASAPNAAATAVAQSPASSHDHRAPDHAEIDRLNDHFAGAEPLEMVTHVLERYGKDAGIAFSGAEDVALIDMAASTGLPFSVFTLETGRLHPETYRFIDKVRSHYGISIDFVFPDRVRVEELVRKKGLFSFYEDGHGECCAVRKIEPLGRALSVYRAWISGQRRDQSPTRADVANFELDTARKGKAGPLLKSNPLASWSLIQTWKYLKERGAPTNELHERGFISIGCEPCTRAIRPGEHERAGRWWWEEATKRECGLHTGKTLWPSKL
jgi:phosphoadenosine phosphosulfate reductase